MKKYYQSNKRIHLCENNLHRYFISYFLFSGWNDIEFVNDANKNRHSSGSMPPTSTTSTIIFTSDALKKLRKSQLLPEPPQGLNQCPPPPDLNSLASKLTRPAPNFLASATTYSRKRQNNSFQKGKKHCNVNLYPMFLLYSL